MLKGKRSCLSIVYYVNMSTKSKTYSEFLASPSVKFRETWQTGSKCFTLVGARLSGKSIGPVFFAAVKDITLQKSRNLPLQTLLFRV